MGSDTSTDTTQGDCDAQSRRNGAALVIIGALNWGLAGAFNLDLVAALFGVRFGETSGVTTAVYSLVGLAGLNQALTWQAIQRRWQGMTPARA